MFNNDNINTLISSYSTRRALKEQVKEDWVPRNPSPEVKSTLMEDLATAVSLLLRDSVRRMDMTDDLAELIQRLENAGKV